MNRPKGHLNRKPRTLSNRQRQILGLRLKGSTYQDIADQLGIMHSSVHHHIRRAYRLLDVHTLEEAYGKMLEVGEVV